MDASTAMPVGSPSPAGSYCSLKTVVICVISAVALGCIVVGALAYKKVAFPSLESKSMALMIGGSVTLVVEAGVLYLMRTSKPYVKLEQLDDVRQLMKKQELFIYFDAKSGDKRFIDKYGDDPTYGCRDTSYSYSLDYYKERQKQGFSEVTLQTLRERGLK